jgi:aconitase A
VVLALTEFLRKEKVVGAYLEFFRRRRRRLTIGDRATISNMAPEYGATAAMFFIDQQTLDYLRLTGRDAEQVQAGRNLRQAGRPVGRCAGRRAVRARAALRPVERGAQHGRPVQPARKRLPPAAWPSAASPPSWSGRPRKPGLMPDGAVIIAAITSCTNTSNPRNVIAAGLLARNANALGLTRKPWVKTSLAPGSKAVQLYLKKRPAAELESSASASSPSPAPPATA